MFWKKEKPKRVPFDSEGFINRCKRLSEELDACPLDKLYILPCYDLYRSMFADYLKFLGCGDQLIEEITEGFSLKRVSMHSTKSVSVLKDSISKSLKGMNVDRIIFDVLFEINFYFHIMLVRLN